MFTIGGQGSISGAIIGATIITLLPQILRPLEEGGTIVGIDFPQLYGLTQIIMAVFLVVLLIKRPFGIMGYREFSLRDLKKLLRKILRRNTVLN
jgi:branched-chain amino acid transport system permease protein